MARVAAKILIGVMLVLTVVLPAGMVSAEGATAEVVYQSAPVFPVQAEANVPLSQETIHIVQPGETLFRISIHYGVPMSSIISANNLINPSRIYAGQRLIIPTGSGSTPGAPAPGTSVRHVVQQGEILSRIASQYGVSMWAIAQANNISNPSMLYAGQVLVIPGSSAPSTGGPAQTVTYTVQRGDTLYRIAVRHGVSVSDVMAFNNIANANHIEVGQQLTIPLTPGSAPPPPQNNAPPTPSSAGKLILVDLSAQRTYAYENGVLLREFVVSTGLPGTPTVTGDYAIYVKYRYARMIGPGYDLPNVPYVMYFYRGYGLHGTYWHNNFGRPMSHGCVNLRTSDAEWLFNWAPVGTTVRVIY